MHKVPVALTMIVATMATAPVQAKDQDVEHITVMGAPGGQSFGEKSGISWENLAQSAQVFDAELLQQIGVTSVGGVLRLVPSAGPGTSRVAAWQSFSLKIRGFMADQMRNGMRQRYYEDVDASALSNVGQIEVLKGPSGVLYGQSAVGGVVSIITKRPQAEQSAALSAAVGSDQQRRISADVGGGVGEQLAVRVTGELERSDTFIDHQQLDRNNLALSVSHGLGGYGQGHFVSEYVERETKRYAGLPASYVLGGSQPELDRGLDLGEPTFADLSADAPLLQYWLDLPLAGNWTLSPRLQYQEFNTEFGDIRVRDPLVNEDGTRSTTTFARTGRHGREDDDYSIAQLDLNGRLTLAGMEHQLLLGYERGWERGRFTQYNIVSGDLDAINVLAPVCSYSNRRPELTLAYDSFYDLDSHAYYLQDQISVTEALHLVAAVRYSDLEASQGDWGQPPADVVPTSATIWQLGATYALSPQLTLFAGVNTGFDMESAAGARSRTNEPLEPEESRQQELGVRWQQSSLRASAAVFEIERLNALTSDPVDPDYSINDGEQRVRGFELEGEWQPLESWWLMAGYAYMDGEVTASNDGDQGGDLGDLAPHTLTGQTRYQLNDQWALTAGYYFSDARPLVTGGELTLDSYQLVDLGLSYQVESWQAALRLNNLLDEEYYTASGNRYVVIPGDPRSLNLTLSTHW